MREQKPRCMPLLSVKRTHLSSLHSELFVQSSPSAFVPDALPEEDDELLVELVELDDVDPPELDPPDEDEPLPPPSELQATVEAVETAKKATKARLA